MQVSEQNNKKKSPQKRTADGLAGAEGFEPSARGFGDRYLYIVFQADKQKHLSAFYFGRSCYYDN